VCGFALIVVLAMALGRTRESKKNKAAAQIPLLFVSFLTIQQLKWYNIRDV